MFAKFKAFIAEFLSDKKEQPMSDTLVNVPTVGPVSQSEPVSIPVAVPVENKATVVEAAVETGVKDFEKALALVEHIVSVAGADAKDEAVALAKKFL